MTDYANNAGHQANPGDNDAFDAPHQAFPNVEDAPEEVVSGEVAVVSEIDGGPAVTDPEQLRLTREGESGSRADAVPDGSAEEVLDWVGEDQDRARRALEAEAEGKQRKGLTADLQELVGE